MKSRIAVALLSAALAGCASLAPEYERPAAELPAAWQAAPAGALPAPGERWWTIYGDPALDRLVDEALAHNRDLALAVARVDEARALARIANAERYPALDASGVVDRSRISERTSVPYPAGTELTSDNYRAALNASYELDLWGRVRNANAAARAGLLATQAAQETVRLTLTADVTRSYFNLVALDGQVAAVDWLLKLRLEDLELQKVRYRQGLLAEFNLRQLEAEVATNRAELPALKRAREVEEAALTVLLGRSPRAVMESAVQATADKPTPPVVVPEGLPSELLLRRPDLAEAEQRLIAANAQIGVARAQLFPTIRLTGYLGSESASLADLFTGPAGIWQLAAGLTQPIFQGGRLLGEVEAAEARQRQAAAQYEKAVQAAFRDVRQALVRQSRSREVFDAEVERIDALTDTLRLARIRYDLGLSSQLEVLDAERNLLRAVVSREDALRDQRNAVTDLVRALGGGWEGLPPEDGAPGAQAAAR
jgi:multidrug efflux system outer membrane protein